jgi:hypothetical protein
VLRFTGACSQDESGGADVFRRRQRRKLEAAAA